MLEVKNLKKSFEGRNILRGIDISVEKGDVIAVIGPSGAGKTTLLRCMNYLEKADEGTMIFGSETYNMPKIQKKDILAIRKRTAFVFQNYNLFSNKTALKNITEGLIIGRKIPKDTAVATAVKMLEKVGLAGYEDYYPVQLSGGQQQRCSIARAVLTEPELLLADEPTGNLDSKSTTEIMELFKRLNEEKGLTILQVTHSSETAEYGKRIIRLANGKVAG